MPSLATPRFYPWFLLSGFLFLACYAVRPSAGGGKAAGKGTRRIDPAAIALPAGYRIEAFATGLTYPTAVTFDDSGGVYALEGGYAYGERWTEPRLLRVVRPNILTVVAAGDSNGPWTGVSYHQGAFYIAEGGQMRGGRILKVTQPGKLVPMVEGLPSLGDHHTNGPAVGPDGMLYFGQGTATNSAVVGEDNFAFGWLPRFPEFHDRPCRDVVLSGVNYISPNPLTKADDSAETGPYSPFGTRSTPGQVIKGELPCNGSVMRVPLAGGAPELVAWGFRNPFALAFSPQGKLYVLDNGYDERGSRPVWGTADLLWEVVPGTWYGWPDYSGAKSLDRVEFKPPGEGNPALMLNTPPSQVPEAVAYLPVHSSADGMDFSRNAAFGHEGQAFVALFGDMAPSVGKVLEPVGFRVVRVDLQRKVVEDFALNRKSPHGPASQAGTGGLERPVSLKFSPDGKDLYVVDFGVMAMQGKKPQPRKETGVIWRIWKEPSP